MPASLFNRNFREAVLKQGAEPLRLGLRKPDGSCSVYETVAAPEGSALASLNPYYAERILKFLLWQRGAATVYVGAAPSIGEHLRSQYCESGARGFDARFMSMLFEHPFEIRICRPEQVPELSEREVYLGRHLEGCRVGFDLGASDRKASAVLEGTAVYGEEVPWDPRNSRDPEYHYAEIMRSIRSAAARLPRLDAVGGSAAGIYVDNRVRAASLFRGVATELFETEVAPLFCRIASELNVPLVVINDGEVTALAGSMSLGRNPVLGIAMGSSLAAGYVNQNGSLTGWLNELAFAPIDYRADAPTDEWSGDRGCGAQYFSQVGAIRLAEAAGVRFDPALGLPEKLVILQQSMAAGNLAARKVYQTLGTCLGYAIAHYADFYLLEQILVLGRVTTGPGGEAMLASAREVLRLQFPELSGRISMALPDEASRRVGQAVAAASLPEVEQRRS